MAVVLSLVAALLLGLLALQGWALLHLRGQQTRLTDRLDRLGRRPAARLAPEFALPDLAGGTTTLTRLRAAGLPTLLVFTDPRCGPCYELLPDLGGWQRRYGDRLTIALISSGSVEQNRAMTAEYGIQHVVLQDEREVADLYGVRMAPAAVVVEPDAAQRGAPVSGAPDVRTLAAETLGLVMPPTPVRERRRVTAGQPAPAIRRPDLDGNGVDLAVPGEPTLLLFWSPGCHHCQELAPEIRAWEARPRAPRIVVVSRGPVGLNREARFAAPVVLDDDRVIAETFGVAGTPAAVVIDGRGVVVSAVMRGASGVRALVERPRLVAAAD